MIKVRITVIRKASYDDLIEVYEKPLENPCSARVGQVFVSSGEIPEGFCESAWETIEPFVKVLAAGGGSFYGEWMKNQKSAMLSCNDGFRPVSFLLEATE